MQKPVIVFAVVVGLAAGALGREIAAAIGAVASHRSYERFDMSVGVTAGQAPRRAERLEEDREVLNVPGHYGTLVSVTGDANVAIFWYRDVEGAMRNAVVRDPALRMLKIQSVPSSRYETDVREEKR